MGIQIITSKQNPRFKEVKALKEKKGRMSQMRFLAEGHRILTELQKYPEELLELWMLDSEADRPEMAPWLQMGQQGVVTLFQVPADLFREISDTVNSQGIVAVARLREHGSERFLKEGVSRGLYADCIQDPGNLGTMIRSAEALGFHFVLIPKGTTDPYSEKCVRASMGSIFHLPVIRADQPDLELEVLKDNGFQLVGADLEGSVAAQEASYRDKLILIIGNEGNGMSDWVRPLLDLKVRIPMQGSVESLNAAIAMSILAYEIQRG